MGGAPDGHQINGLNMVFYFASDDHCPIHSVAILCMCDADPLRAVQQQIGAMSSRIRPLL